MRKGHRLNPVEFEMGRSGNERAVQSQVDSDKLQEAGKTGRIPTNGTTGFQGQRTGSGTVTGME